VERRINRLVAEHVLRHLRAPVLELGCGEGAWTDLLVERLGALTTVDAAPALLAARKARWGERLTTHAALFEDFEPREPYAHVLLASVLHHVEDPVGLLRRIASWLGSGSLWVTVPNAGSLHRRLGVKLGALQRDTQVSEQGHAFGHRRTYTRAALLDDLARAGLVSVREEGLWLKPLSNAQMEGWEPALHEAFFALGQEVPVEQSAILLVECKRRDALPRALPGPALPPDPWEALEQGPMFLMTADQDWAPPWACEAWLAAMRDHGITPHVFRTSPCPVLDAAAARGEITQGWHPNFLPGSTQGHDAASVLQTLRALVPGATTARAHAYRDDSYLARALVEAGVRFLSHPATRFEPKLKPLQHHSGLWLLPVFYEDDIHFDLDPHALGLGPVLEALDTPGLKVFDLHPTFFACNTPSRQHHELHRAAIFGSERPSEGVVWGGRGAASASLALLSQIARRNHPWYNLEALCRRPTPAR
jgi:SAM-dependent methyltransferase